MYLLEEGLESTDGAGLPGYIRFLGAAAEANLEEAVRRVKGLLPTRLNENRGIQRRSVGQVFNPPNQE